MKKLEGNGEMKTTAVRLSAETIELVGCLAKRRDVRTSTVLRSAIEEYIVKAALDDPEFEDKIRMIHERRWAEATKEIFDVFGKEISFDYIKRSSEELDFDATRVAEQLGVEPPTLPVPPK